MKKIYSFLVASLFSVMLLSAAPTTGLQFSGVSASYINCGVNNAFSPAQFTIEVWAYYESTSGGYIISNEGWEGGANQGFSLRTSGSKIEIALGANTSWPSLKSTTDISLNTWMHVAVTYSGTDLKLYVNGVEDATAAVTTPMVASNQSLCIGEGSMWKDRRFTGKMSDLRLWNVVKTQTEIAADMTSTLTGIEEGLIAGWKMDEGTGATIADVTGNHNLTKPDEVAWFGPIAGVKSVGGNAANIESAVYGRTLEVANKTNGKLQLTIYSVTGQKVMEDVVGNGNKYQKELTNNSGSYILKCTAEDGAVYAKRFIVR